MENHARHSTSIQPFCFWDHSSWTNVSYCGRNCQCTVNRSGPIFVPLASVLATFMGGNASIRAVRCAVHSRSIDLTDERGVGRLRRGGSRPTLAICRGAQAEGGQPPSRRGGEVASPHAFFLLAVGLYDRGHEAISPRCRGGKIVSVVPVPERICARGPRFLRTELPMILGSRSDVPTPRIDPDHRRAGLPLDLLLFQKGGPCHNGQLIRIVDRAKITAIVTVFKKSMSVRVG